MASKLLGKLGKAIDNTGKRLRQLKELGGTGQAPIPSLRPAGKCAGTYPVGCTTTLVYETIQ